MTAPDQFQFGTRSKQGIMLGLDGPALGLAGLAIALSLAALLVVPRPFDLLFAVGILVLAAVALMVPVPTRTAADWVRCAGGWAIRSAHGAASGSTIPLASSVPPHLLDLGIKLDLEDVADGPVTWGLHHAATASFVAVMLLNGQDFGLRDDDEQRNILAGWGTVLASLARKDSPIQRAQIIETAVPDGGEGAVGWYGGVSHPRSNEAREDYEDLLDWVGSNSIRHTCLLALALQPRHKKEVDPLRLVLTELSYIRDRLSDAHIESTPLTATAFAEALERAIFPPAGLAADAARADNRPRTPRVGCLGWSEARDQLLTDGWYHSSAAVTEWPRRPVPGDWLAPLLTAPCPVPRTISIHIRPVEERLATRRAEHAVTSAEAEAKQREKMGFSERAGDTRAREALEARRDELSAGASLTALSAVITVSAPTQESLALARAEIDGAAARSQLVLESCWGEQRAAFIASLPLCKGGKK